MEGNFFAYCYVWRWRFRRLCTAQVTDSVMTEVPGHARVSKPQQQYRCGNRNRVLNSAVFANQGSIGG